MEVRALVITGSRTALKDIREKLESLAHEAIHVSTQKEALKVLSRPGAVDYVVVDLEVQVEKRGRARLQNGVNLIRKIRALPHAEKTPLFAVVKKELANEALTIEAMWNEGASVVTHMPLPDEGFTLEVQITTVLEKQRVRAMRKKMAGGSAMPMVREPSQPYTPCHPVDDHMEVRALVIEGAGLADGRAQNGQPTSPIIVIAGQDKGASDHVIAVMRTGGIQCVQKSLDGSKLDKAVREALNTCVASSKTEVSSASRSVALKPTTNAHPQPFISGKLVFYPDRVELCGVKILSESGLGHCRRMLDMLREKRRDRFIRIGGEELARKIGEALHGTIVIGTITGCAKTLRNNIRTRLKRDLNLICEDQDVLVRDEQGYHLNDEKITVEEASNE